MKTPPRLVPLVHEGLIDSVLRQLMSGKEATVYAVRSGQEVRCAKVYKDANKRNFRQAALYQEGRKTKNSRQARAMAKGTRYGRQAQEEAWQSVEVDTLFHLAAAGVRVPHPYAFSHGVVIMELVTDADGNAAPRLNDLALSEEVALAYHATLIGEVVRMLCAGIIHGDLSEYNVLVDRDGPVIIDLPQAVNAAGNNNAQAMLRRDVDNVTGYCSRFAPALAGTRIRQGDLVALRTRRAAIGYGAHRARRGGPARRGRRGRDARDHRRAGRARGALAPQGGVAGELNATLRRASGKAKGPRMRPFRLRLHRVVGARRFELPTPCTPCRCATRLRYAPTELAIIPGTWRYDERSSARISSSSCRMSAGSSMFSGAIVDHGGAAGRRARGGARLGGFAFEAMARAVDREALLVEEVADAADQQHFVVLVVAAVAAPLHRLQLREFLLPVTEHVRLDRTEVADLANREVTLGGDRRQVGVSSAGFRHGSRLRPWPSVSGLRGMSLRGAR